METAVTNSQRLITSAWHRSQFKQCGDRAQTKGSPSKTVQFAQQAVCILYKSEKSVTKREPMASVGGGVYLFGAAQFLT